MIGIFDGLVVDCADPQLLGVFYAELLVMRRFNDDPDSADVIGPGAARPILSFRRVKDYSAPQWPEQVVPQQMRLDVKVDALDVGEAAVQSGANYSAAAFFLGPARRHTSGRMTAARIALIASPMRNG
jgi:hypothetical protein